MLPRQQATQELPQKKKHNEAPRRSHSYSVHNFFQQERISLAINNPSQMSQQTGPATACDLYFDQLSISTPPPPCTAAALEDFGAERNHAIDVSSLVAMGLSSQSPDGQRHESNPEKSQRSRNVH